MSHHFTVDVEEYFQVSAFESRIARDRWETLESRVVGSVLRLLDLLGEHGCRGTFFVLGWVAQRHPEMVRTIASSGHEIASHGWDHRRVVEHGREDFRASVRRTKQLLEDTTGLSVLGYRAPTFSIVPGCEWALDVLIEEGHSYDSSLFPVRRIGYGYPDGQRDPHWIERASGRLAEVPPATLRVWGVNLPAAGGGYFRLLPYALSRAAVRDCQRRGVPATFYIHPWEVDPDQPRLDVPWLTRLRHYGGLKGTVKRLRWLLSEFHFCPIAETVKSL
jgi:polysaccharide deacetylase family protein (PEP-CTERM system associated)